MSGGGQHQSQSQSPGAYSREATLDLDGNRIEALLPEPPHASLDQRPLVQYRVHPAARYLRRGPWENTAVVLIGLGVVMLMQPLALTLFTWSFVTILAGTALFVIVSHFPE